VDTLSLENSNLMSENNLLKEYVNYLFSFYSQNNVTLQCGIKLFIVIFSFGIIFNCNREQSNNSVDVPLSLTNAPNHSLESFFGDLPSNAMSSAFLKYLDKPKCKESYSNNSESYSNKKISKQKNGSASFS